jgi:hypothetical protein
MAIYYGDGSNSNSGRIIKISYADSSAYGRTSINATSSGGEGGQRTLWTALTHSKVSASSSLRVQMHITGGVKYSYPYYGTGVRAEWSGGNYTTFHGSNYSIGAYIGNGQVLWLIDYTFTPSNLSNQTGNIGIKAIYRTNPSQGGNDRPFNIWNPNASDDNRGFQKQSTCIVTEFVPN